MNKTMQYCFYWLQITNDACITILEGRRAQRIVELIEGNKTDVSSLQWPLLILLQVMYCVHANNELGRSVHSRNNGSVSEVDENDTDLENGRKKDFEHFHKALGGQVQITSTVP